MGVNSVYGEQALLSHILIRPGGSDPRVQASALENPHSVLLY